MNADRRLQLMSVTEIFGKAVIKANKNHPALSRGILRAGWRRFGLPTSP